MTPEQLPAAKARLAELNAENTALRDETLAIRSRLGEIEARRAVLKDEYGKLFESVGLCEKAVAAKSAKRRAVPVLSASAPEPVPLKQASRWQLLKAAILGAK